MERFMIELTYAGLAILIGFGFTIFFYILGYPFVRPALYIASLIAEDRGGESLMPAFIVINTAACAIFVYLGIRLVIIFRQN